jgi:hypothetical protein
MVYNSQNGWVSELCPLLNIPRNRKHNILEFDVPSVGKGRVSTAQLGSSK